MIVAQHDFKPPSIQMLLDRKARRLDQAQACERSGDIGAAVVDDDLMQSFDDSSHAIFLVVVSCHFPGFGREIVNKYMTLKIRRCAGPVIAP